MHEFHLQRPHLLLKKKQKNHLQITACKNGVKMSIMQMKFINNCNPFFPGRELPTPVNSDACSETVSRSKMN